MRHDRVDQPDLERALRRKGIAGQQQFQRALAAGEPRQPLRAAEGRRHAEIDLGLGKLRAFAGDAGRAAAVASERAQFAKPEINLGMPPTFGGTQRLPRLVGRKRALEFLLTGDSFPPQRALEIGLINAIVPHEELLPAARALAQRIIRHSPLAVAAPCQR